MTGVVEAMPWYTTSPLGIPAVPVTGATPRRGSWSFITLAFGPSPESPAHQFETQINADRAAGEAQLFLLFCLESCACFITVTIVLPLCFV